MIIISSQNVPSKSFRAIALINVQTKALMSFQWLWVGVDRYFRCLTIFIAVEYSLQLPFRVTCTEFNYVFIVIYLSSTLQFVALCLFAHIVIMCLWVFVCASARLNHVLNHTHTQICVLIFSHCSTSFYSQNKLIIVFIVIASHRKLRANVWRGF